MELTNVSMAKITIKSMDYPTKMSMTYGGTGTLLVNVKEGNRHWRCKLPVVQGGGRQRDSSWRCDNKESI
jgi:hypothetical protein